MLTNRLKLLGLISLFFIKPLFASEENKFVYTVAVPRSLGTVFLRTFENRPDFIVYNEPLCPAYSHTFEKPLTQRLFQPYSPLSFEEFKSEAFKNLETSNVMAKDLSFATYFFIKEDIEFLSDPRVHFIFLIRDPHQTSISFYLKQESPYGRVDEYRFHPDRFHKLLGFEHLFHLYHLAKKHSPNQVTLIFAADLGHNPSKTIENLCLNLSIPYIQDALHFTPYSNDYLGQNWHELKKNKDHFLNWHGEAAFSTSISPHTEYELDDQGNPTFSEVVNSSHRIAVKEAYQKSLPYYEFFKAEAKKTKMYRDDPIEPPTACSQL